MLFMRSASLKPIVDYCDRTLRTTGVKDYDGAVHGLQVENSGSTQRIAPAVDGTAATIRLAMRERADLLIVHHGLFWTPTHPSAGKRYELMRTLLDHDIAVFSSHLPLDAHPRLGNNVQLCRKLGLKVLKPFFFEKGQFLGFQSSARIPRQELVQRLAQATGTKPILLPGGPPVCQRIGVVTGGAGSQVKLAAAEGVDTFITGEGPHWTYALAEELGVNVLYGGHYATETFGVKALAAELSRRFRIPWVFLEHPTGL